jgi:hypothetical protein
VNRSTRSRRGNMLALIAATTMVIVAVILFALWYVSTTMGTTAHRTAIETAALAAASDLGRIAIQTKECGWVSLTGVGPIGTTTKASDNYYCQVHSINELIGTARLDSIIASKVGDSTLQNLADGQLAKVLIAKNKLVTALRNACKVGGSGKDVYGNVITPYDDAKNLYLANQAVSSSYVNGSFALSLGSLKNGIATAIKYPDDAQGNTSANYSGYYRSEVSIPYGTQKYVFGSVGRQAALGDNRQFVKTVSGLPYQIPCVVQVSSQQKFKEQGVQSTTQYTACATAGGVARCPTPPAFTIAFPDGPMDELNKPEDLAKVNPIANTKCRVKEAVTGDYPVDALPPGPGSALISPPSPSDWSTPVDGSPISTIFWTSYLDWLRSGGSTVNIDSASNMLKLAFAKPASSTFLWASLDIDQNPYTLGPIPTGIKHIYEFNADGSVLYKHKVVQPDPYLVVARQQMYAENNNAGIKSSTPKWQIAVSIQKGASGKNLHNIRGTDQFDFYCRDEIHQPGIGKHDGEACDSDQLAYENWYKQVAWKDDMGQPGAGAWLQSLNWAGWSSSILGSVGAKGSGLPPMLTDAEDFALTSTKPMPAYETYSQGPPGGKERITYTKYGIGVELRFRRQIYIHDLSLAALGDTGYIGLITNPVANAEAGVSVDPDTAPDAYVDPNPPPTPDPTATP